MSGYALGPTAKSDVKEIWDYTVANFGHTQAEDYVWMLLQKFEQVGLFPLTGVKLEPVRKDYHRTWCGSHTIIYKIDDSDGVEIVRVLHQNMDIDVQLD